MIEEKKICEILRQQGRAWTHYIAVSVYCTAWSLGFVFPTTNTCKMSTCTRCGADFSCAMAEGASAPCWCTQLPPALPLPGAPAACWCPACLKQHIAAQQESASKVPADALSQPDRMSGGAR
jgi:hypothetical protein